MNRLETIDEETFSQWINYCFNKSRAMNLDVLETIEDPDGTTLAKYFRKLFESPMVYLGTKSFDEIAAGLWFIFGASSEYWWEIRGEAPRDDQARAVLSLATMYIDCFDLLCDNRQSLPAKNTNQFNALDGAVYMLWDMDCIEGAAMNSNEEHLVGPIFTVLERALGCQTVACQISALHGLGHLQMYRPDTVHKIIEPFLREQRAALPWVDKYAKQAIKGQVL